MDYILLSALIAVCLVRLVISYDIACMYFKYLASRMEEFPSHMHIDLNQVELRPAVPSFHIRAHGIDCQNVFSFAFLLWVGRTVGEDVESGWAHMNLASASIIEMAPGNRHETLDDHWGGWNWQKIIGFSEFCYASLSNLR